MSKPKKTKRGRPPAENPPDLDDQVWMRVSSAQKTDWRARAAADKRDVSTWLRLRLEALDAAEVEAAARRAR